MDKGLLGFKTKGLHKKDTLSPIYKATRLENGVMVLSESQPFARAVSIGIYLKTGTRDELKEQMGISHLIEHMVFKGTESRSAYDIAASLEEVGGELNAYTTREYTCYHALVLKDHWRRAVDVLGDLVTKMKVKEQDFELEKSVVLSEMDSTFENPEDYIYDVFLEKVYGGHGLSWSILGSQESIKSLRLKDLKLYYQKRYRPENMIVSAAGDIDHRELVHFCQRHLRFGSKMSLPNLEEIKRTKPKFQAGDYFVPYRTEQNHVLFGLKSTSFTDRHRFEAFLLNAVLGGGMTSRLFQSVRERRALSYNIHSSLVTFTDAGLMFIYASIDPKDEAQLKRLVKKELRRLYREGLDASEIKKLQTQVVGSILLGSDDVENRMNSLAINEMVLGRYKSVDEVVDEILMVNSRSMKEFLQEYLHASELATVVMGRRSK